MHGHGFTMLHCVTVIAGRKACLPPIGSSTLDRKARQRAAEFALRGEHRRLGLERDGVGDDTAARLQRGEGLVDQRRLPATADEDGVWRGSASSVA